MDRVYPSKVDWWMAAMLIAGPAAAVGIGIYGVVNGATIMAPLMLFFAAIITVTEWALTVPCRYTLTDSAVIIQCGWINDRIPYSEIRDAVPSSNPLSAPALSLSRVKIIRHKGFSQLISPKDREGFIRDLNERVAKIQGQAT
jgi:hypothetical protein